MSKKAPNFNLKDKNKKSHSLNSFKNDYTVIYFYPKDDTPGCTIEAKEFTKDLSKFKKAKITVVGISGLDEKSKAKFSKKYSLKVLLLSDPDFKVCKKYGVYAKKVFMGKKYMGIKRTTFILNKKYKIIKRYNNVKAEGHSKDVLEFIKKRSK